MEPMKKISIREPLFVVPNEERSNVLKNEKENNYWSKRGDAARLHKHINSSIPYKRNMALPDVNNDDSSTTDLNINEKEHMNFMLNRKTLTSKMENMKSSFGNVLNVERKGEINTRYNIMDNMYDMHYINKNKNNLNNFVKHVNINHTAPCIGQFRTCMNCFLNVSTLFCKTCNIFLCAVCNIKLHKDDKKHIINAASSGIYENNIKYNEIIVEEKKKWLVELSNNIPMKVKEKCIIHTEEYVKFACKTCDYMLLCPDCLIEDPIHLKPTEEDEEEYEDEEEEEEEEAETEEDGAEEQEEDYEKYPSEKYSGEEYDYTNEYEGENNEDNYKEDKSTGSKRFKPKIRSHKIKASQKNMGSTKPSSVTQSVVSINENIYSDSNAMQNINTEQILNLKQGYKIIRGDHEIFTLMDARQEVKKELSEILDFLTEKSSVIKNVLPALTNIYKFGKITYKNNKRCVKSSFNKTTEILKKKKRKLHEYLKNLQNKSTDFLNQLDDSRVIYAHYLEKKRSEIHSMIKLSDRNAGLAINKYVDNLESFRNLFFTTNTLTDINQNLAIPHSSLKSKHLPHLVSNMKMEIYDTVQKINDISEDIKSQFQTFFNSSADIPVYPAHFKTFLEKAQKVTHNTSENKKREKYFTLIPFTNLYMNMDIIYEQKYKRKDSLHAKWEYRTITVRSIYLCIHSHCEPLTYEIKCVTADAEANESNSVPSTNKKQKGSVSSHEKSESKTSLIKNKKTLNTIGRNDGAHTARQTTKDEGEKNDDEEKEEGEKKGEAEEEQQEKGTDEDMGDEKSKKDSSRTLTKTFIGNNREHNGEIRETHNDYGKGKHDKRDDGRSEESEKSKDKKESHIDDCSSKAGKYQNELINKTNNTVENEIESIICINNVEIKLFSNENITNITVLEKRKNTHGIEITEYNEKEELVGYWLLVHSDPQAINELYTLLLKIKEQNKKSSKIPSFHPKINMDAPFLNYHEKNINVIYKHFAANLMDDAKEKMESGATIGGKNTLETNQITTYVMNAEKPKRYQAINFLGKKTKSTIASQRETEAKMKEEEEEEEKEEEKEEKEEEEEETEILPNYTLSELIYAPHKKNKTKSTRSFATSRTSSYYVPTPVNIPDALSPREELSKKLSDGSYFTEFSKNEQIYMNDVYDVLEKSMSANDSQSIASMSLSTSKQNNSFETSNRYSSTEENRINSTENPQMIVNVGKKHSNIPGILKTPRRASDNNNADNEYCLTSNFKISEIERFNKENILVTDKNDIIFSNQPDMEDFDKNVPDVNITDIKKKNIIEEEKHAHALFSNTHNNSTTEKSEIHNNSYTPETDDLFKREVTSNGCSNTGSNSSTTPLNNFITQDLDQGSLNKKNTGTMLQKVKTNSPNDKTYNGKQNNTNTTNSTNYHGGTQKSKKQQSNEYSDVQINETKRIETKEPQKVSNIFFSTDINENKTGDDVYSNNFVFVKNEIAPNRKCFSNFCDSMNAKQIDAFLNLKKNNEHKEDMTDPLQLNEVNTFLQKLKEPKNSMCHLNRNNSETNHFSSNKPGNSTYMDDIGTFHEYKQVGINLEANKQDEEAINSYHNHLHETKEKIKPHTDDTTSEKNRNVNKTESGQTNKENLDGRNGEPLRENKNGHCRGNYEESNSGNNRDTNRYTTLHSNMENSIEPTTERKKYNIGETQADECSNVLNVLNILSNVNNIKDLIRFNDINESYNILNLNSSSKFFNFREYPTHDNNSGKINLKMETATEENHRRNNLHKNEETYANEKYENCVLHNGPSNSTQYINNTNGSINANMSTNFDMNLGNYTNTKNNDHVKNHSYSNNATNVSRNFTNKEENMEREENKRNENLEHTGSVTNLKNKYIPIAGAKLHSPRVKESTHNMKTSKIGSKLRLIPTDKSPPVKKNKRKEQNFFDITEPYKMEDINLGTDVSKHVIHKILNQIGNKRIGS